jgi:dUTP pyrophosphatase
MNPLIKIEIVPGGKIPTKGSEHAACYDVYAREIYITHENNKCTIYLGFKTEIPDGWKGVIVPRSSITKGSNVMQNSPAQIDSDYRGEWILKFDSLYRKDIPATNERIAQIYFEPVYEPIFEKVNSLSETQRGEGGFGSTGK